MDERQKKLARIRKLLALGNDERGNPNEVEAAMRMANKLMAELGIEEAEVNMAALDDKTMIFGESDVHPDGRAFKPGMRPKTGTTDFGGVLSVGVAIFTDTITRLIRTRDRGWVLRFQGEKEDVLFAAWLFNGLANSVQGELKKAVWLTARSQREAFREAAAAVLQHRLKTLRAERTKIMEEAVASSASRALVVVDRKQAEIKDRFGEIELASDYTAAGGSGRSSGLRAGSRINIPTNRPLNAPKENARLA